MYNFPKKMFCCWFFYFYYFFLVYFSFIVIRCVYIENYYYFFFFLRFTAHLGLGFYSLFVQYYSVICRPSAHTVGRPRAENQTRNGRSRGKDSSHKTTTSSIKLLKNLVFLTFFLFLQHLFLLNLNFALFVILFCTIIQ